VVAGILARVEGAHLMSAGATRALIARATLVRAARELAVYRSV
jgi:hypothetical protein